MPNISLSGTAAQRNVVFAEERILSVFAGRRWGKTFTFLNRAAYKCLKARNFQYWYVAPVYAQAKEQYDRFIGNPALAKYIERAVMQPYPVIHFMNGSRLAFRTFDRPANLRGSGLNEIWCDEIQSGYEEKDFWPVVRPLISDKRGTLVVSGQFRGKNWYYDQIFVPGQEGPNKRPGYKSWRFPSSSGLVYSSDAGKEELEIVKQQIPRRVYEVEYECLPIANEAAVFDHEDLARAKRGTVKDASSYSMAVAGLDLGRVVDPSAVVVIDGKLRQVVYAGKRPLGEKHEIGAQYAASVARRFNNCQIVVDTTGGATGGRAGNNDAHVQFYRKTCPTMRAFTINRDNKERLITNLSLALEQGKLAIPAEFEDLHKELASYEYKVSKNGIVTYQGPGGHDDDMVIALALAWEGCLRGWYKRKPEYSESII